MPNDEPTRGGRPVQVAKRKQKPLGREELAAKKRSKTTKAAKTEEDEVPSIWDNQEDLTFILPKKHLDKVDAKDEDKEPRVPRVRRKGHEKRQRDQESSTRIAENKPSHVQRQPDVEKSAEPPTDRFVKEAQEELMRMIEVRASDEAIENQMKIIKMFRARLPSQEEPGSSSAQRRQPRRDTREANQTKAPNKDVHVTSRPKSAPMRALSISSSSTPARTPSPAPRKNPRAAARAKAETTRAIEEEQNAAFPAFAPTSLPFTQQTNESLTTEDVAKLSKVHSIFDEAHTNKFDRHTRKFNSTKSMASDKLVIPNRGLESRIRAPTDSPPAPPRAERRGNKLRLDAATLKSASAAAAAGQRRAETSSASTHRPAKNKVTTSARELEASVSGLRSLPSRPAAVAGPYRAEQPGRSGQVYNHATAKWYYVEERDSDDD